MPVAGVIISLLVWRDLFFYFWPLFYYCNLFHKRGFDILTSCGLLSALQVPLFCFSKRMLEVSLLSASILKSLLFVLVSWPYIRIIQLLVMLAYDPACFYCCSVSLTSASTDIAHRLEMVRMMLQKLHCNVFMLSYRGYVSPFP